MSEMNDLNQQVIDDVQARAGQDDGGFEELPTATHTSTTSPTPEGSAAPPGELGGDEWSEIWEATALLDPTPDPSPDQA